MLELELEQWREALEKGGMKVSRAKIVSEWNAISVKKQSAQLSCHRIQIAGCFEDI